MRERFAGLWRSPDFLRLWAGQTISQFGTQVTLLAVPLTAALTLRATAVQMGLLAAAGTLPILLLSLVAGAWVDRLRRRPLLIAADLGRALLLLAIPLTAALGVLHIAVLYAVAFLVGVLNVFFDIAYQAFLPTLIRREHLVEGNSKLETSRSAAQIAGPGLAGGLAQLVTAPLAIILDALSFLGSAFFLGRIRTPEPPAAPRASRRRIWGEIGEGLRIVGRTPVLRALAGCTGTANFFNQVVMAVLVLYMTRELAMGPGLLGLVFASGNVGFLLGASLAGRIAGRFGLGPTLIGAPLLAALGALFLPFARGPLPIAAALLVVAQFLGSLGGTIYSINQLSVRQAFVPDHLQGRMSATMRFIVLGTQPLGALVGGALGGVLGLWPTLVLGAVGRLLPVLWVWFSPIRILGAQPPAMDEPATAAGN